MINTLLTPCLVIGYIALGIGSQLSGHVVITNLLHVKNLMIPYWSLSLGTQIISTSLIAGRIWWHAKRNSVSKSRYISLIAIIVESGAIFALSTVFLLAFFDLQVLAAGILSDMSAQIAVRNEIVA